MLGGLCGLAAWLVSSLVHAGDAVVPTQGVLVEQGPEEAEAEGAGGEEGCDDAAAHGGSGGVFVGEGAEANAGVAHAGGSVGEGEKEELVEESEGGEGADGAGDGQGARDFDDGVLAGEVGEGEGEDGGEGDLDGEDEADVDDGGHEAEADGRRLRDAGGEVLELRVAGEFGDGKSGEEDGGPLGGEGFGCGGEGELVGLDLEDAEV